MSKKGSYRLKTGDFAPDFILQDQHGQLVRMQDFHGKKIVVLFFYPKDETPVCTNEAKCFRDYYEDFSDMGAEVLGISADSVQSHSFFADRHSLPFILLSDPGAQIRKLYGIPSTLGLIPGRVTFVIDHYGRIRHIFSSQFHATKHVHEALEIVKLLHEDLEISKK